MGNRCNECNKFVGLETQEPEEDSIEVSDSGTVTIEVTIRRNCSMCDSEMKSLELEATEEVDGDFLSKHSEDSVMDNGHGHGNWSVELDTIELTESGGGRWAKNMIGFSSTATVTCVCGETTTVTLEASEAASSFDDSQ